MLTMATRRPTACNNHIRQQALAELLEADGELKDLLTLLLGDLEGKVRRRGRGCNASLHDVAEDARIGDGSEPVHVNIHVGVAETRAIGIRVKRGAQRELAACATEREWVVMRALSLLLSPIRGQEFRHPSMAANEQHTFASLLLEARNERGLVLGAGLGLDAVEAVVSVGVEELERPGGLELFRKVIPEDFLHRGIDRAMFSIRCLFLEDSMG